MTDICRAAIRIRVWAPPETVQAAVVALRRVFDITAVAGPYPDRNPPEHRLARVYLDAAGIRATTDPGPAGPPSPLAAAEDAKRRRDLLGEIGVLQAADRALHAQPWYPLLPGDVVLAASVDDQPGETYLAVDDPQGTDIDGCPSLRMVSHPYRDEPAQPGPSDAPGDGHDESGGSWWAQPFSFYELWFEAGPHALTVIRAGQVLHGRPKRGGRGHG